MYIAKLTLRNWMCFAGEHELLLQSTAYAIVARLDSDEARSNFLGKTAFVEAIGWVLYGRHRHRTDDEVITRGEKSTEVEVAFDDGARIVRTRSRGKPTKLRYHPAVAGKVPPGMVVMPSYNDVAQESIVKTIGLDEKEFFATVSIEQRQMAKLVRSTPGELTELAAAWLGLQPLEEAYEKVRAEVAVIFADISRAEGQRDAMMAGQIAMSDDDREGLRVALKDATAKLTESRATLARAQSDARIARERSQVEEEGSLLAKAPVAPEPSEIEAANAAFLAVHEKKQDVRVARDDALEVTEHGFDGQCPVLSRIPFRCPAIVQVNAEMGRLRKELPAINAEWERVVNADAVAEARLQTLVDARTAAARVEGARQGLRERWKALNVHAPKCVLDEVRLAELGREYSAAQSDVERLRVECARAEERLAMVAEIVRAREEIAMKLVALRAKAAVLAEVALIFGRQGAQRRIAEEGRSPRVLERRWFLMSN